MFPLTANATFGMMNNYTNPAAASYLANLSSSQSFSGTDFSGFGLSSSGDTTSRGNNFANLNSLGEVGCRWFLMLIS